MATQFFGLDRCALVGMVHLLPLPGSPGYRGGGLGPIVDAARRDGEALLAGGCDAVLVENMGDVPYLRGRVEPETVAAATLATHAVAELGAPTGVQILAGANREALGVALAAGAVFMRAEAFAYAHIADEGFLQASAGTLLRARRAMSAEGIAIWADVQKKHSAHAITGDLDLGELAHGTAFCGADALVITGLRTGASTSVEDLRAAAGAGLPLVVGSGVTPDDAGALAEEAAALIVGSYLKLDGDWRQAVDPERVKALKASLPS